MLKKPSYFPLILTSLFLPLFLYGADEQVVPNTPPGISVNNDRPSNPRGLNLIPQTPLTPERIVFTKNTNAQSQPTQEPLPINQMN